MAATEILSGRWANEVRTGRTLTPSTPLAQNLPSWSVLTGHFLAFAMLRSALTARSGERQGLSVAEAITLGIGLGLLAAAMMRPHALVDTAQETHLKCSSLNSAWQQIALGDHYCPEPSATNVIESGLGQPHALVEGFSAVGSPGYFHAWMAVAIRKVGDNALSHLVPPRASERARR